MIAMHISGVLIKTPAKKITRAGKPYALASVLLKSEKLVITLSTFDNELVPLLLNLKQGDVVSATGVATITVWQDNSETWKPSVTLTANRLMAVADGKRKKQKPPPRNQEQAEPFDDFGSWELANA